MFGNHPSIVEAIRSLESRGKMYWAKREKVPGITCSISTFSPDEGLNRHENLSYTCPRTAPRVLPLFLRRSEAGRSFRGDYHASSFVPGHRTCPSCTFCRCTRPTVHHTYTHFVSLYYKGFLHAAVISVLKVHSTTKVHRWITIIRFHFLLMNLHKGCYYWHIYLIS